MSGYLKADNSFQVAFLRIRHRPDTGCGGLPFQNITDAALPNIGLFAVRQTKNGGAFPTGKRLAVVVGEAEDFHIGKAFAVGHLHFIALAGVQADSSFGVRQGLLAQLLPLPFPAPAGKRAVQQADENQQD